MLVRKARLQDATNIYELVNSLSQDGTLLRRVFAEICENVRDFTVAESEAGVFLGCGALHLYGPHLAEVRSIVVKPEAKSQELAVDSCFLFWKRPRITESGACACLRGSRISFSAMGSARWKIARPCRTRFLRIARIAHGFIAAMKLRWRGDRCPEFRSSARASRPSSWCGFRASLQGRYRLPNSPGSLKSNSSLQLAFG